LNSSLVNFCRDAEVYASSWFFSWDDFLCFVNCSIDREAVLGLIFLSLSSVAIYANAAYLVMMTTIPSSSIAKISFPILSKHWKNKRIDLIEELYKKSSLNQF